MGKTILITGMSGIKIEASVNKFISDFKEFRTTKKEQKPVLIKFDSEMENEFYLQNPHIAKSKQVWKNEILKQSYPVLEKLWKSSFEKIILKIDEIKSANPKQNILLNIHSCYFHNRTQEYISLIDLKFLEKISPSLIVTVIDDIYEIHHRLTEPGGIYHDETNVSNTQMILRLLRLLDWRAKETMMSRFLANQLGIKNYVFAVKHSFETFSNLLFEDLQKAYLSHPITEVRRLQNRGLHEEANKIMSEITEISDRLSSLFTTFLPTTIDEFRIKNAVSEDGHTKNYYAVLGKRWESEIFEKPKDLLYINSGFKDINELWKLNTEEIPKLDEQINNLLETLSDIISDQVTVRDYTLVEQSNMLVIYRPIFNGNASGGVFEEFRYYKKLIKDTGQKIMCYIYCPEEDINKYYVRQFELKIKNEITEVESLRSKDSDFNTITDNEAEQLLKAKDNKSLILDVFDKVIDNHKLEILIKNEKTPLGENKIMEFKEKFASSVLKSFNTINEYKEDVTYFESREMSVEKFINNIQDYHNKN